MKKYSIIYADPPWRYKVYSKKGLGRSAESHYPTMELEDIRALPVGTLAADDCVLFLYGDRLITLSTCEYSRQNGRMVVVAKKIVSPSLEVGENEA